MKNRTRKSTVSEEKALLSFLKQTRQGKYAQIDETSLHYIRVKEDRRDVHVFSEDYYYSLS